MRVSGQVVDVLYTLEAGDVVDLLSMWVVGEWEQGDLACMAAEARLLEVALEQERLSNQPQDVDSDQMPATRDVASVVLRRSVVVWEVPAWRVQGTWSQPRTGLMWDRAAVAIRQHQPTTMLVKVPEHIPKM